MVKLNSKNETSMRVQKNKCFVRLAPDVYLFCSKEKNTFKSKM